MGELTEQGGWEQLSGLPAGREDFAEWAEWAEQAAQERRWPVLREAPAYADQDRWLRHLTACRAILGQWTGRSVVPDDAPLSALQLLASAQSAPPHVVRASRLLTQASLEVGATSTDVLFLVAAWAWPLRDVDPQLSDTCWEYLIWAPWQTDSLSLRDMLIAVHQQRAFVDGRSLMDLIGAREAAGLVGSAREWLEAVVLIQTRQEYIDRVVSYREFAAMPQIQDAHEAIVALAGHYERSGEAQPWAREVMKRAVELTRAVEMIDVIEARVWDRTMDEAYQWSEQVVYPGMLDHEVKRAVAAGQPHHARRLAEAVLVRRFARPWTSTPFANVPAALEAFAKACQPHPVADPVARRAAEHLGVLYTRTQHATLPARTFTQMLTGHIAFCGAGAALHPMKDELELFYNQSDPYHILRREADRLAKLTPTLSDDERAASDKVQRWFSDRFRHEDPSAIERLIAFMASPMLDVARVAVDVPLLERAVLGTLRVYYARGQDIAGDLEEIARRGAQLRSQYGWGAHLMEYARELVWAEPKVAGVVSAGLSAGSSFFLPPGFNLKLATYAVDLGATLLLALRGVARISAAFGRDPFGPDGFGLLSDTLALGLSGDAGEGLIAGLSRGDRQVLTNITVGTVAYGSAQLVEHLWCAPGAFRDRVSAPAVSQLARLAGLELSATGMARAIPAVGAVISGVSAYAFVRNILDAALHVAARDALVVRQGAYDGGE
jgi:hypothetical protein